MSYFLGESILGIFGWGYAAGTLEPLAYIRASSAEFFWPILDQTTQIPLAELRKFKHADLIFFIYFWVAIPGYPSLD